MSQHEADSCGTQRSSSACLPRECHIVLVHALQQRFNLPYYGRLKCCQALSRFFRRKHAPTRSLFLFFLGILPTSCVRVLRRRQWVQSPLQVQVLVAAFATRCCAWLQNSPQAAVNKSRKLWAMRTAHAVVWGTRDRQHASGDARPDWVDTSQLKAIR